jgi:hypothetical protein
MMTTETPPNVCLKCRKLLDRASHPEAEPEPGDLSICIECGHVMVFDDGLRFRAPTPEESMRIATDERVRQMRANIQQRQRAMRARYN